MTLQEMDEIGKRLIGTVDPVLPADVQRVTRELMRAVQPLLLAEDVRVFLMAMGKLNLDLWLTFLGNAAHPERGPRLDTQGKLEELDPLAALIGKALTAIPTGDTNAADMRLALLAISCVNLNSLMQGDE